MNIPIWIYIQSKKWKKRCKGISKLFYRTNRLLFSCEIDPSADI